MIRTHFPRRDGEDKKTKKGAGICFQLVTVYIQHEKYAGVRIPRGFKERPIKRQRKKVVD